MEFKLRKASDWEFEETINVERIEDLEQYTRMPMSSDGIVTFNSPYSLIVDFVDKEIMIYDNYVE